MGERERFFVVDRLEARVLFTVDPFGDPFADTVVSAEEAVAAAEPPPPESEPAPDTITSTTVPGAPVTRPVGFKILDGTNNPGRPELLDPSTDMGRAFVPHSWQMTDAAMYDWMVSWASPTLRILLDLEVGVGGGFPTGNEPPDQLQAAMDDRMRHFDEFRARLPNDPLALYAFNPGAYSGVFHAVHRHEAFLDPNSPAWMRDPNNPETAYWLGAFESWQHGNDVLSTYIGDRPDYLAPQVYVFNNNRQDFDWLLQGTIKEARRQSNGKPVYAFLMPYYWEVDNNPLGAQPHDYDFFRYELERSLSLADGVVIWGGWNIDWDPNAGWVAALRDVLTPPPPAINVSATDALASEAGDGASVTFSRTTGLINDYTVNYTLGGTATAGVDFAAVSGSVVIPAGQTSVTVPLATLNDNTVYEGDETVVITLAADPAYVPGASASATVTIADDDPAPVVTLSATDATAAETGDTGRYTFTRTANLSVPLTVAYSVGGTATAGDDYTPLSGTLTFATGQASVAVSLVAVNDVYYEAAETVTATLVDGALYDLGTARAGTVTITSNDPAPAAPSLLTGVAVTGGRIDLSWKDNSTSETGFVLEWSLDNLTWSSLGSVGPDMRAFSKSGLARNTNYWFRVRAVAGTYASAWSNTLKLRSASR
jgi:hypothetical protein